MFHRTLIAHRGVTTHAPENTLAAVQYAIEAGFAWVEVDVQWSADGVPVLFHDRTFVRFAGPTVSVESLPWSSIRALSLCDAHSKATFAPPDLASLLELVAGNALGLNLELKYNKAPHKSAIAYQLNYLKQLFRRYAMPREQLLITSFSRRMTKQLSALNEYAHIGVLVNRTQALQRVRNLAISGLQQLTSLNIPATLVDVPTLRWARTQGIAVLVYTVNEPAQASALFTQGVNGIFTDTLTPEKD